ncbi:hypothetical protein R3W88_007727 [Solanum pinnatisectum]|uniref:Reverse transcriptase zinc-binding domain-containing protein n=1 Tax=Solanum pinnatisectum TaxID=50273 RepID=A0AAV9M5Z6_9SOLN|nr:hypothetical protein R3W88_007727 [Solanum pinnatisectum]
MGTTGYQTKEATRSKVDTNGEEELSINSHGGGRQGIKHSIICWIVMHRRLLTRDKLAKMGICQDKDIDHLFFEYEFSKEWLKGVLDWLKIEINNTNIEGIWRRVTRKARGRYRRSIIKVVLAALIYHIWLARNGALWNKAVTRPATILNMIKKEIRSRTNGVTPKKCNNIDITWIDNLFN